MKPRSQPTKDCAGAGNRNCTGLMSFSGVLFIRALAGVALNTVLAHLDLPRIACHCPRRPAYLDYAARSSTAAFFCRNVVTCGGGGVRQVLFQPHAHVHAMSNVGSGPKKIAKTILQQRRLHCIGVACVGSIMPRYLVVTNVLDHYC